MSSVPFLEPPKRRGIGPRPTAKRDNEKKAVTFKALLPLLALGLAGISAARKSAILLSNC
jgi:hypothetical protein